MTTERQKFAILEFLGFQVPEYGEGDADEAAAWHDILANGRREKLPYEIDGTVMRVNDLAISNRLGEHNMRPRGSVAFKFDPVTAISRVVDVKWQVGNSGRITPVASVEPAPLGGVTITSISLHNMSMFRELQLYRGCRVLISRRNDVIPYIEERLDGWLDG
jgi:DNA ligase (NAD+)